MAKILVVDDRPVDRDILASLLRYHAHSVIEAANGEKALAKARAGSPDLIIADILMPRMDGFQLLRQLRADPALAYILLIFYPASYDTREAVELTTGLGVAILPKPSEPQVIVATVHEA